jgi:hypothetical protein
MDLITTTPTSRRLRPARQAPGHHRRYRVPAGDHLLPLLCVVQMASAEEAVVIDTAGPGHRPQAVLRADGEEAC